MESGRRQQRAIGANPRTLLAVAAPSNRQSRASARAKAAHGAAAGCDDPIGLPAVRGGAGECFPWKHSARSRRRLRPTRDIDPEVCNDRCCSMRLPNDVIAPRDGRTPVSVTSNYGAGKGETVDDLDSKNLGRLRRIADTRTVWISEAGDFTPWLAENIDVLADALGMSLTVVATEVGVGDFRLDIHAKDGADRSVVIENQLERTDHGHLGQCLVYASGLDASAVVWVAPKFREEFRSALDWLNERTTGDIGFFGVEVGIVQIGNGPLAPVFDVVSRPNDWQKTVKTVGDAAEARAVNPINAARQAVFIDIVVAANARIPAIAVPTPQRGNWVSFASGPFGYWCLSVIADGRLRVEAYIDTYHREVNKALLDEFAEHAGRWEAAVGFVLSWERLDDKRAARIAAYRPVDLDDPDSRASAVEWAVEALVSMYTVLNAPLRTSARTRRAQLDGQAAPLDLADDPR